MRRTLRLAIWLLTLAYPWLWYYGGGARAMLAIFTASLIHPPTVIERLARLQHPDLPPEGVRYTRRVTQIWCGFFVINGSIIAALALLHADRAWTWYTGFISYLLMGALFAGEWIYRRIYLPT